MQALLSPPPRALYEGDVIVSVFEREGSVDFQENNGMYYTQCHQMHRINKLKNREKTISNLFRLLSSQWLFTAMVEPKSSDGNTIFKLTL